MKKTSVYLENAEINARCHELGKSNDIGVMFDKVDQEFGLEHDDLRRAMYVAAECGTDDLDNVKSLLSVPERNMLKTAYCNGEIDRKYLARWMKAEDIDELVVAVG